MCAGCASACVYVCARRADVICVKRERRKGEMCGECARVCEREREGKVKCAHVSVCEQRARVCVCVCVCARVGVSECAHVCLYVVCWMQVVVDRTRRKICVC
jgi:hypothetical protein